MANTKELVTAWQDYFRALPDWEALLAGVDPIETGYGQVFELSSPFSSPDQSFVICDMEGLKATEPHYHKEETELHFVLHGLGRAVIGRREQAIARGSVLVIPPETAHYIFPEPETGLLVAVINTPAFSQANYVPLKETDLSKGFDDEQFHRLGNTRLRYEPGIKEWKPPELS